MANWRYSSTLYNLDTWCRWVVSYTPNPIYSRWKKLGSLNRRLGEFQRRSGRWVKEIIFRSCRELHHYSPAVQPVVYSRDFTSTGSLNLQGMLNFIVLHSTKFVILNTWKMYEEDCRCVYDVTYIHKISQVSMVHSMSHPDRKIKTNFLECIVFFFHILQKIDICSGVEIYRSETNESQWSSPRRERSHTILGFTNPSFTSCPSGLISDLVSSLTHRSSISNSPWAFSVRLPQMCVVY